VTRLVNYGVQKLELSSRPFLATKTKSSHELLITKETPLLPEAKIIHAGFGKTNPVWHRPKQL
jgi:hypothetical protein